VSSLGKAGRSRFFHRKIRRTEVLIVRRAFGAQRGNPPGGGSANLKISPSVLLTFL
jgi:hypothetical protein